MSDPYDCIIVGQGLAGTTLAWWLRWAGERVLLLDREEATSASRVAAGLITPVTGRRLVKTWEWDRFWPAAATFYRKVEEETGARFFLERPMVRLFASAQERDFFQQRTDPEFRRIVRASPQLVNQAWFASPHGGFEMLEAGRLDVPRYLAASREVLRREGAFLAAEVDEGDIRVQREEVLLEKWGARARRLVFCQGHPGQANRWFSPVRYNPAKGELLTLRIPGMREERVIHRGAWLAPADHEHFRVGATYEWEQLDQVPTEQGREELCGRLSKFLRVPFEVIGHSAAVRPAMRDSRPVLGVHPREPKIGIFNGLGSKGALLAPELGRELSGVLFGEGPLDPEVDVKRWFR